MRTPPTPAGSPVSAPVLVLLLLLLGPASAFGAEAQSPGPATTGEVLSLGGVVTAEGAPLAGAEVRLLPLVALWSEPARVAPVAVVRTGADGGYTLAIPGPGPWAVRAEAPGRAGRETVVEVLDGPKRLPAVDLVPARDVEVRVVAPRKVTEGAAAWPARRRHEALPAERWRTSFVTAPIEDGAALLSVPATGPLEIQVVVPGAVPARVEVPDGARAEVTVVLEPAAPVALRVVDAAGRPLPRIRIFGDGGALPIAETGPDGRASAVFPAGGPVLPAGGPGLPAGGPASPALILVAPDGRVFRSRPVRLSTAPGGEVHRLRFAPPHLSGRVVQRGTGRPLADALVWSRPPSPGGPVRTDAAGRFELPDPGGKTLLGLVAAADAHRIATVELPRGGPETASHPELAEGVEIALSARRRATGRVVDAEDRPVSGARVRLTPVSAGGWAEGGATAVGPVRSGADGVFALPNPRSGWFDLAVEAEGFGPTTVPGLRIGAEALAGSETVDLGVVVLTPGAEVAGRVVDDDGEPVADARVLLAADRGRPWEAVTAMEGVRREVRTDEAGAFLFTDLQPGERLRLRAQKTGYGVSEPHPVTVPADGPVRIVLRRPAVLAGWVLDGAGRAVEDALVTVERAEQAGPMGGGRGLPGVAARTSTGGGFELRGLPVGRLVVKASAPGFRDGRSAVVEVASGEEVPTVEIVLRRAAAIHGRVIDEAGAAVPGATVDAADPAGASAAFARSDREGRFRLAGLRLGTHALVAVGPGGREARRVVEAGDGAEEVTLVLEGGVPVRGRILRDDGSPVAEARVVLMRPGGRSAGGSVETRTGPLGRFGWSAVPAGAYHLQVSGEGLSPSRPVPVTVDGRPVEDLEIVLNGGVTLRGRVLGVAFDDLSDVVVRVPGVPGGVTGVDHAGGFVLPHLPMGEVVLVVELEGTGRRAVERIDLPTGATGVDASVWLPEAPVEP